MGIVSHPVETMPDGIDDLLLVNATDWPPDWSYDFPTLVPCLSGDTNGLDKCHFSSIVKNLVSVTLAL
jgi:hypothetical protein